MLAENSAEIITDLAGNVGTSSAVAVAYLTVVDATVAQFVANQSTLDQKPSGFNIVDKAQNVSSAFDALNVDGHLSSIQLTDAGTPILTLTVARALDDTAALL